jgi:hypothetical protein
VCCGGGDLLGGVADLLRAGRVLMFDLLEILRWLQAPRTQLGRVLRWIGLGLTMIVLLPIEAVYERVSQRRERRERALRTEGREAG